VYGLKDRLVDPRTASRAARTFPDNRMLLLPDSGHVSQMEHPGAVAAAIRRLVETPSSPTP
jgi:pimeloyl-ACP methyl ester carboxylesterase